MGKGSQTFPVYYTLCPQLATGDMRRNILLSCFGGQCNFQRQRQAQRTISKLEGVAMNGHGQVQNPDS